MIKFLIGLATVVTSFISLFTINSSAVATPLVSSELNLVNINNRSVEKPISLNTTGSLWQLSDANSKDIFDHLGCSCGVCSQAEEVEVEL